jgi:hypothetical protein
MGDTLAYAKHIAYTICLCSALIIVTQTTIVTMFGPSKALKGETSLSVKEASENMRQQQWYILYMGMVCIICIFFGVAVENFMNEHPYALAVAICILFAGFLTGLFYWGRMAYFRFHVDHDITTPTGYGQEATDYRGVQTGGSGGGGMVLDKAKGTIWVRQSLEEGGNFLRRFGVLEKGCIDIYESEEKYNDHDNPLNVFPVKLWLYNLETDPRKFAKSVTSINNSLKSSILGNEDFSVKDLLLSRYDLPQAAKHFKFALIPKISSELATADMVELLAHDEKTYKHWIRIISKVINGYQGQGKLSVEQTIRSGTLEVETVVRAANT